MFIAAVLTGSILGYAAAGIAILIGMPFSTAFLALLAVGMSGALITVGIAMLQNPDQLQDETVFA